MIIKSDQADSEQACLKYYSDVETRKMLRNYLFFSSFQAKKVYKCNVEGFGDTVFVAKHIKFDQKNGQKNFIRESTTLAQFDCKHIIQLVGVYEHPKGMGIILEYADCSLGALLHEEKYEQRKYHLG